MTRSGIAVDALVNNAGYGLPGGFLRSSWDQHRDFIQVMVTAVAELCYRFAPAMAERERGWIINVASVAGLVPGSAGHTLYGAAKSLVIRFSESLALELRPRGVNVTALCPGFTYSEFHDVNDMRAQVSRLPKWMWMDADTVARQAYDAVMRGEVVYVNGRMNRMTASLARHSPDWLINKVLKRFAKKIQAGVIPDPYRIFRLTITPALKLVSRVGWLLTHSKKSPVIWRRPPYWDTLCAVIKPPTVSFGQHRLRVVRVPLLVGVDEDEVERAVELRHQVVGVGQPRIDERCDAGFLEVPDRLAMAPLVDIDR